MKSEFIDWFGGKVKAYEVFSENKGIIQSLEPKRNAVILERTGSSWTVSIECKHEHMREVLTEKAKELLFEKINETSKR